MVSSCCRELNTQFKSIASLNYHAPDTCNDIPPYIDTKLTSFDSKFFLNAEHHAKEQIVPFFNFLVWFGLCLNPQPAGHKVDALPIKPLCWSLKDRMGYACSKYLQH